MKLANTITHQCVKIDRFLKYYYLFYYFSENWRKK
jgi:hypothetical protein